MTLTPKDVVIYCSKCGKQILNNENFCMQCGSRRRESPIGYEGNPMQMPHGGMGRGHSGDRVLVKGLKER